MKKLLGLLVGLFLTVSVFGQGKVVFADTDNVAEAKTMGIYHFEFDNTFTDEQISKVKAYYTDYFTVNTLKTDAGIYVTLKLADDSEMSKRVVQRFFVSLNVQKIDVMGTEVLVSEFIKKFVL